MSWSAPSTRSTGDMVTAAIWNQDVVNNPTQLHDWQVISMWTPVTQAFNAGTIDRLAEGAHVGAQIAANGADGGVTFVVPSDYVSLVSLTAIIAGISTATLNYDLRSFYGAAGEAYNNHNSSSLGATLAVVANTIYSINIASLYASLAAGDYAGFGLENNGTTSVLFMGVLLRYTPY